LCTVELQGGEQVLVNVPADHTAGMGQELGLRLVATRLSVFTI
jgi:hypothetical protein